MQDWKCLHLCTLTGSPITKKTLETVVAVIETLRDQEETFEVKLICENGAITLHCSPDSLDAVSKLCTELGIRCDIVREKVYFFSDVSLSIEKSTSEQMELLFD